MILQWKRKSVIYDTISACSNILYVLAERWEGAKAFRNSFEQISKSILSKLEDENGNETEIDSNADVDGEIKQNCSPTFAPGIANVKKSYLPESLSIGQCAGDSQERGGNLGLTDGVSFALPSSVSSNSSLADNMVHIHSMK